MMLEMSFLYNHITIQNDSVVFHYNDSKLNIEGISVLTEEVIFSIIKNDKIFKSALAQFLRDRKINIILNEKL